MNEKPKALSCRRVLNETEVVLRHVEKECKGTFRNIGTWTETIVRGEVVCTDSKKGQPLKRFGQNPNLSRAFCLDDCPLREKEMYYEDFCHSQRGRRVKVYVERIGRYAFLD